MTTKPDLPTIKAEAFAAEFEESFVLEIELANDCSVTLTVWKDGYPPGVGIWTGNGSHMFNKDDLGPGESLESFRHWVEFALGGSREKFEQWIDPGPEGGGPKPPPPRSGNVIELRDRRP
jgi:hypothetical protein